MKPLLRPTAFFRIGLKLNHELESGRAVLKAFRQIDAQIIGILVIGLGAFGGRFRNQLVFAVSSLAKPERNHAPKIDPKRRGHFLLPLIQDFARARMIVQPFLQRLRTRQGSLGKL
jgi:hypothetical protein